MAGRKPLVLGEMVEVTGDVTQNRWIGARSARALETSLGYGTGRLSGGWAVLLLKQALVPEDFEFGGITLRSGGRERLPASTAAADALRPRVHDQVLREIGTSGYRERQLQALRGITPTGENRLAKVIPMTPHDDAMAPSAQYPMGGGGLQWKLVRPCRFLVAMLVDAQGNARLPGFSVFLGESAAYEARARVDRYLDTA